MAQLQTYGDHLAQQVELTKDHHATLGKNQNIALDLDPETPLNRRTAALRHALLIAEIEATAQDENTPDWDRLGARYKNIWAFQDDYQSGQQLAESDEVEELKELAPSSKTHQ